MNNDSKLVALASLLRKIPLGFGNVLVRAGDSMRIDTKPAEKPFRGTGLLIDDEVARHFIIDALYVGKRNQFVSEQSGLPGRVFEPNYLHPINIYMDTLQVMETIGIAVRNVSETESIPFLAIVLGDIMR